MNKENNYAFIDGQNVYMATSKRHKGSWNINLKKFRIYLKDKYHVTKAFYYLGYVKDSVRTQELYEEIQNAGFVLVFRQHNELMMTKKKGNVDSDIIFNVMKKVYKDGEMDKVVIVSVDGDYKNLVDFLVEEDLLLKILFPDSSRASSLYKKLGSEYYDGLDKLRSYIE